MKTVKDKVNELLAQIEELDFTHANCIKLISLVYKVKEELTFLDEKPIFKNNVRQTINKEVFDLIHFSNENQLERLFDNVKLGMIMDKNKYWDINTFDK